MCSDGSIMEQRDCVHQIVLQITHLLISMVRTIVMHCMLTVSFLLLVYIEVLNSATDILQSNTSVLTVSNINATQNGGVYECVVINDAGFSVVRSTLYVNPMIVEHPMDQLFVGNNVTFRCRAESFPYPQYQWQKYNTTNEIFEDITGADQPDYEIGGVMHSDHGYYRCKVTAPVINETVYSNNATLTGEYSYIPYEYVIHSLILYSVSGWGCNSDSHK